MPSRGCAHHLRSKMHADDGWVCETRMSLEEFRDISVCKFSLRVKLFPIVDKVELGILQSRLEGPRSFQFSRVFTLDRCGHYEMR